MLTFYLWTIASHHQNSEVGRITAPKDVHTLVHRIYGYASLRGKRDFANVIKVRDLELEDYPGLCRPNLIPGVFKIREPFPVLRNQR